MFDTLFVVPCVFGTIRPSLLTLTILLIVGPGALINRTVFGRESTLSMKQVIFPLAHIYVSVGVLHPSLAIFLSISLLPDVLSLIVIRGALFAQLVLSI